MTDETLHTKRLDDAGAPLVRAHQIFVVFDADRPLAVPTRHSLAGITRVVLGRGARRSSARSGATLELRFDDARMSQTHATLAEANGIWSLTDEGSTNGARVNGRARSSAALVDGDRFDLGHMHFRFREALVDPSHALDDGPSVIDPRTPLLASLIPALARDFEIVAKLARSAVPLVLQAETGSGKEVVARSIHTLSSRPGPFVAVNCGAIAPNLLASELFGYRRGAFSGATEDREGLVRSADGGTLLLDEVAELSADAQTALLRVLQEREVLPVGATRPVPIDVRVLAASHSSLRVRVAAGSFRADLLARLSGFTVRLPPMRERSEDFGSLVAAVLRRVAPDRADRVTFTSSAVDALLDHSWPFNVRELERALEAALVLATSDRVALENLPESIRGEGASAPVAPSLPPAAPGPAADGVVRLSRRDDVRRRELVALLTEHEGNVSTIARRTGKARAQIYRWLKRYGLDAATFVR